MLFSVLTVSDRCSRGECEDKSGVLLSEILSAHGEVIKYDIVSDDIEEIKSRLIYMCDELKSDIIFTTGGTGFAPRDVTPEATKAVIEKEVPGIAETIRYESLKITPKAMLSRAAAGIRGRTLVINLPGSPKAVRESLEVVLPVLSHAAETLSGNTISCGGDYK
ncbi:MAG: MogA/MoaB family molybdenum cofactor biosynthesis protein [Clostridia bacterium]|nr:MogA/MoaB family molybdenum cofactor biosynthesis protein [Clostridia bacterium]